MKYIFLFTFISMNLFSQEKINLSEYECNYLVKFQPDTLNENFVYEEMTTLLLNDKTSIFKSSQKAIYDSLTIVEVDKSFSAANGGRAIIDFSKLPVPKFKPEVFKSEEGAIGYNELLKVVYEYPIDTKLNWKILNETKTIKKYECRKAITTYKNRDYIAWFTNEIPFPEGPYVFKGLPGLVIEVYDTKNFYYFSLEGLKKTSKPIIAATSQIRTEYTKFVAARNNFIADPAGILQNRTGIKLPPKSKERVEANARNFNNFLD